MRKLKLQVQISADGYVAGPSGELDWMTFNLDPKLIEAVVAITESSDTILLGRKMTEGFVKYWESVPVDSPEYNFAEKMVGYPKIVFSKTTNHIEGKNLRVENGDLFEAVQQLEQQDGKDIVVYGGAGFVSSLIKEGLIDEFNFFVNPVMINKGLRIFDLLNERQKLSLISSISYYCGICVLRYNLSK